MKILLVDDHPVVREGLAGLLRGLLPDVQLSEAGDGEHALLAVQREIPSLVIVDLDLPGINIEQGLATRLACQQRSEEGEAILRDLTRREFEIFRLLARGLAMRQVAEQLGVSGKTVSNHVSLLKQKLQVSTQAELVHRAIDSGVLRLGLPLPLAEKACGSVG